MAVAMEVTEDIDRCCGHLPVGEIDDDGYAFWLSRLEKDSERVTGASEIPTVVSLADNSQPAYEAPPPEARMKAKLSLASLGSASTSTGMPQGSRRASKESTGTGWDSVLNCDATYILAAAPDANFGVDANGADQCGLPVDNSLAGEFREFARQVSCVSTSKSAKLSEASARSDAKFSDPAQTMIIFDWDDTLFPTAEFIDNWGIEVSGSRTPYVPECEKRYGALCAWREALKEYLEQACIISDHVVIVTNSRRGWVTDCITVFHPELEELFTRETRSVKLVYAKEKLPWKKSLRQQALDLRPISKREFAQYWTEVEISEELTAAKFHAIREEVKEFYSKYEGQTWKNIICFGDMRYERDAVQEVVFRREGPAHENIRLKTFVLPTNPTISEITLRMCFSSIMLKAYASFDGSFDLDLQVAEDPLIAVGEALEMPELSCLAFSRHAWGRDSEPPTRDVVNALAEVAITIHECLYG